MGQVRIIANKRRCGRVGVYDDHDGPQSSVRQGAVFRERVGRAYEYSPRFTEPELVAHLSHGEVTQLVTRYGDIALAQSASAAAGRDEFRIDIT